MSAQRRAIWSWAFVDWANSAFAIVVMTAFFPLFFKDHWSAAEGMTPERSTWYLGLANGIASAAIAVLAPLLGSIADQGNSKKRFLLACTFLGCIATALLPLAARGDYVLAAALYTVAAFAFSGNNLFNDALLTDVAPPDQFDRVSALGYGLGYVGSGALFVVCSLAVATPARFGFDGPVSALNFSLFVTAGWWLLFTIPCMLWVHETPGRVAVTGGSVLTRGFRQLTTTFRDLRRDRRLLLFLAAYILYIDGVNTVIKMAADFARTLNIEPAKVLLALILTQFVAFPAAIAFGRIGERLGPKRGIMIGLVTYCAVCVFATQVRSWQGFMVMAVVVGMVQGGVQALSRSFFARMVPAEKGGEYFGFYNMVGKFAAILGPVLYGFTALYTTIQHAILSLLVLFVGGMWLLTKVKDVPATAGVATTGS